MLPTYDLWEVCPKCGANSPQKAFAIGRHGDERLEMTCWGCGFTFTRRPLDFGAPKNPSVLAREAAAKTRARTAERIATGVEAAVEGEAGKKIAALIRRYAKASPGIEPIEAGNGKPDGGDE